MGYGSCRGVLGGIEVAAVGEAVRGDVKDAHENGSLAKWECAGAKVPVEAWAGGEGHGRILVARLRSEDARLRG